MKRSSPRTGAICGWAASGSPVSGIGAILLALVALYFGVDPAVVLNQADTQAPTQEERPVTFSPEEEKLKDFMSLVLADTEDVWGALFQNSGQRYEQPKLVLFSGAVESACGFAEAAVGPFYCPADHKLYLDMDFFNDLAQRHDAPGDFAQAYVVAHEVGHHVQTLLGISEQVHAARQRGGEAAGNALQVRMELQADCFAGVWAHQHSGSGRSSSPATPRRRSPPRRGWATTVCNARRAAPALSQADRRLRNSSSDSWRGAGRKPPPDRRQGPVRRFRPSGRERPTTPYTQRPPPANPTISRTLS